MLHRSATGCVVDLSDVSNRPITAAEEGGKRLELPPGRTGVWHESTRATITGDHS